MIKLAALNYVCVCCFETPILHPILKGSLKRRVSPRGFFLTLELRFLLPAFVYIYMAILSDLDFPCIFFRGGCN